MSAAATPLFAQCPHCQQTIQCYGVGKVKLSAHYNAKSLGNGQNCKGSDQEAVNPQPTR